MKRGAVFASRKGSVEAVAGVDLRVEAHEVCSFLGPKGAGRGTVCARTSAVLDPPDERILTNTGEARPPPPGRTVPAGDVPCAFAAHPARTARSAPPERRMAEALIGLARARAARSIQPACTGTRYHVYFDS